MGIYAITEELTAMENDASEISESHILGFCTTKRGANRFINNQLSKAYQFIAAGKHKKVADVKITCSKNPLMTTSISWHDGDASFKKKWTVTKISLCRPQL